ncbi:MAG: prolipoprotein diacylglyceryl transferase [Elusimicrobiota bacterium]
MHPELFTIGGLTIHTYGVFMALAVVLGYFFLLKLAQFRNINSEFISYFVTGTVIWGFLGARIFYILIDIRTFMENPIDIFRIWSGGLVFSGGLIGGLGWAFYAAKKKKIKFLDLADVTVPALSLGYAVARIGCFMAGCCYGSPSESSCAVVFPKGSSVYHQHIRQGLISPAQSPLSVHPVELYSVAAGLIISYILYRMLKSKFTARGTVLAMYLFLYGSFRLGIEFLRGDFRGRHILFFTPTQWVAAFAAVAGAYMFYFFREKKKNNS